MIYPEIIHGKFVDLRSITLDDAEFSYKIRADKRNCDTVGQLASSLENQRKYIQYQMSRPGDYYFVVLNKKGEKIGLIGVYDIDGKIAETGREVNIGEPAEILEMEILLNDFCRTYLELDLVYSVVYSNNVHHITDSRRRGWTFVKNVIRSGREALYFEQRLDEQNPAVEKIRKLLNRLHDKMVGKDA